MGTGTQKARIYRALSPGGSMLQEDKSDSLYYQNQDVKDYNGSLI